MSDYLSVTEYAEKHGMDVGNIRRLIAQGRIPGAMKVGKQWCIPADTPRPKDKRVITGKHRKKPSGHRCQECSSRDTCVDAFQIKNVPGR